MNSSTRSTRSTRSKRTARLAAVGAVMAAATALLAAPAQAATAAHATAARAADSAVFVQSNNVNGNTVVAYDRAADGRLTQAGVYRTGGLGGVLAGSAVDHLASEHSLTYDPAHHLLYAVNAGSNTVTVFQVCGDQLVRLQVIGSGGEFPVSIAVHGNLVYVLNALDGGSIQGFERTGRGLVRVASWHRALGLDPAATPQFTHTPGQVSFTPDGSALVVTTKAGANSIDVFPLGRHQAPSAAPVTDVEAGTVPFGFTFDRAGRLVVTQAGPNAVATFTVHRNGTLTPLGSVPTGQSATCWITRTGNHLYASNAGSGTVSGFRSGPGGELTALGNTATNAGTVDAAASADGRNLYVQTGAAGIVDEFRVHHNGSLTAIGSVTVPGAVGGEGIATT
ncbi:lactonase family protein [Streptacidiphilus sp. PB12-B1b]|uniref:lactonase family protein n=1 Tax=Streptacidiphilus sp. PB12-B1b TaxID=2705012 RepID=UPI0015FA1BA2|nr:beta-propeller fold lactonase family protein [Streptacidiphilus sp. PB12-B1b]QMU79566.1 lactonase family protein [Streptacidiphilus sp. PB12-B1b]